MTHAAYVALIDALDAIDRLDVALCNENSQAAQNEVHDMSNKLFKMLMKADSEHNSNLWWWLPSDINE